MYLIKRKENNRKKRFPSPSHSVLSCRIIGRLFVRSLFWIITAGIGGAGLFVWWFVYDRLGVFTKITEIIKGL